MKVAEKIEKKIIKGISKLEKNDLDKLFHIHPPLEAKKPYRTKPITKTNKQNNDLLNLLLA